MFTSIVKLTFIHGWVVTAWKTILSLLTLTLPLLGQLLFNLSGCQFLWLYVKYRVLVNKSHLNNVRNRRTSETWTLRKSQREGRCFFAAIYFGKLFFFKLAWCKNTKLKNQKVKYAFSPSMNLHPVLKHLN